MNLTPLKYLLFIENVTTVFRNYLCLKTRIRIVAIIWVLLESFNIILGAMVNLITEGHFLVQAQRIYFFSSTSFSIYVMLASLYYSKTFYSLLTNFDAFHKIFDCASYTQRMLKAQKVLTSVVLTYCGILSFIFTYIRVSASGYDMGMTSLIFQYIDSMCDFRHVFQYFVLTCILFVVSEQLKTVIRSIDSELSVIRENRVNTRHGNNLPIVAVNHDKLNKWMKAYENINDSSNLFNSMFSIQLTIMLFIVTTYYIIILYTIVMISVKGFATLTSLLPNLLSMVVFLSALFVISRAGQEIQDNYVELRQKLCELSLYTLENDDYYKLTKDLLRCVRTRPVRVHVFGSLDVNMSMLPSVVALFTSYTVIALQFNNVL